MKSILAILALCIVYCTAQTPTPCKSPEQWEGRIFQMDRTKKYGLIGEITYDETNQRFRIIEEVVEGEDKEYYDTLYLHNIGREYKLNLKTRKCNVTSLTRPFRPFGVPRFAKFLFEAEVGAAGVPGESVTTQTFDGTFEDGARFISTVSYPDCVPLNFGMYTQELGFATSDFFDLNLGVSNPSVFIPPQECNM